MVKCGACTLISTDLLHRFAKDEGLSAHSRAAFANAAGHSEAWRQHRASLSPSARHGKQQPVSRADPLAPTVLVFDCRGSSSLPGELIEPADMINVEPAKSIFQNMNMLSRFYKLTFNRNSIDNNGMGLFASLNFAQNYCNASWNGQQIVFGEADGEIFIDFALSDEVLAHEFAHGVTQYSVGFNFSDESGALNESMSDVFCSVFRQWRHRLSAERADWQIGTSILGPVARARGFNCLRSLSDPGAGECLSPQPQHMSAYDPNGDGHINSGIPNHAFYRAAMAIGGNTWDRIALIWYSAMATGRRQPNMSFSEFAAMTIQRASLLFRNAAPVPKAVEQAWKDVGVL